MKAEKIAIDIEKSFNKLRSISKKPPKRFGKEDIHRFRTEIKKLNAFSQLLKSMSGKEKKIYDRECGAFYHKLGDIRVLQIQEKSIKNAFGINKKLYGRSYLNFLHSKQTKQKKKLEKIRRTKRAFKNGSLRFLNKVNNKDLKVIVEAFLISELGKLSVLFSVTEMPDESLHAVRKVLKNLQYTWKYVRKEVAIRCPYLKIDLKNISAITAFLGDFHDDCLNVTGIENYITQTEDREELEIFNRILQKWRSEKDTLKSRIYLEFSKMNLRAIV